MYGYIVIPVPFPYRSSKWSFSKGISHKILYAFLLPASKTNYQPAVSFRISLP